MDEGGDFHVALFSALVSELGKNNKRWLAMQLAELLVSRASASAELSRNRTADEAVKVVENLTRKMTSDRPRLPSRLRGPSALPMKKRTPKPASVGYEREKFEAAKKVIRLKFESWRAVKTGAHWHAGFARKMIEQHACVGQQRIIEEWARVWEMEARRDTHATANAPTGDRGSTNPSATP